jgi:hypothetical protein
MAKNSLSLIYISTGGNVGISEFSFFNPGTSLTNFIII